MPLHTVDAYQVVFRTSQGYLGSATSQAGDPRKPWLPTTYAHHTRASVRGCERTGNIVPHLCYVTPFYTAIWGSKEQWAIGEHLFDPARGAARRTPHATHRTPHAARWPQLCTCVA